jgi:glycosyltransferase 2 family protein
MHRTLIVALKLAAFVLICGVLAWQVDPAALAAILRKVRLDLVAAASLLLVAQMAVATQRWVCLLRLTGREAKGLRYYAYFGMGSLTNLSLPGGVAGDVFRVWQTAREGLGVTASANSVILDRLFALATLGGMVAVCALAQLGQRGLADQPIRGFALAVGICVVAGLLILAAAEPILRRLSGKRWYGIFHSVSNSMRDLLTRWSSGGLRLLIIALTAHFLLVLSAFCLARAFGIPIAFQDAFIVFPMVFLVSSVPITPGGWGIREGAMVVALGYFGVTSEAALSLSVTFGILAIAACLPAVLIYLSIREPRTGLAAEKRK